MEVGDRPSNTKVIVGKQTRQNCWEKEEYNIIYTVYPNQGVVKLCNGGRMGVCWYVGLCCVNLLKLSTSVKHPYFSIDFCISFELLFLRSKNIIA